MPIEKKITSSSQKRSAAASNRAYARAESFQRAREKSSDCGASPILKSQLSFDYGAPEEQTENIMSDGVMALLEAMKEKMDSLPTSDQFAAFGKSIENNTMEIVKNTKRMNEQDEKLAKLAESIERLERDQVDMRRGLDSKVKAALERRPTPNGHESYDLARRSLRLWPIKGVGRDEMTREVTEFLKEALEISDFREKIGQIENVSRVEDKEGSIVYSEVVVVFRDRASRDYAATRGRKLANYIDERRKPTCGMRMEIPQELVPTFNTLKKYGFHLRKNEKSNKNHVRFDDFKRSLVLQVKFTGEEDADWISVYPEEAHEALRKIDQKRHQNFRSTFSDTSSPPRKRRPRMVDSQINRDDPGTSSNMDVSEEEDSLEVTIVPRTNEKAKKWKPPPRQR